jgi:RNA polymerase sigma-70 factor (ECF subfamily)
LSPQNAESLFTDWVRQHGNAVLKVARAYTRSPEDCQDLVQEILLQVWRSLPKFRSEASTPTWCYRVALNTALTWCRTERRHSNGHAPLVDVESLSAAGPDSGTQAADRELVDRLYAAIRVLPVTDAALVLLSLEGLSYQQMAEVVGISESNVGVKLHRAKQALAEQIRGLHES